MTAEEFYTTALHILNESTIPFLVGGTYAVKAYTGIDRPTKDLDVFCKAGNYPKILKFFSQKEYECEITDDRWIAKVFKGKYFMDIIFNTTNLQCPVNDSWFKRAQTGTIFQTNVKIISPEELIWTRLYTQDRDRYEGPDIYHLIIKKGENLDWKHILGRMEQHWELLLGHLINFRFIYPADRNIVPQWLMDELLKRVQHQLELPSPKDKVCRGRLVSPFSYNIDINDWGYKDSITYLPINTKLQNQYK